MTSAALVCETTHRAVVSIYNILLPLVFYILSNLIRHLTSLGSLPDVVTRHCSVPCNGTLKWWILQSHKEGNIPSLWTKISKYVEIKVQEKCFESRSVRYILRSHSYFPYILSFWLLTHSPWQCPQPLWWE